MEDTIKMKSDDLLRLYNVMEEIHDLLHQPLKYRDVQKMDDFVKGHYSDIKDLYYNVLWDYLPDDVRENIENG